MPKAIGLQEELAIRMAATPILMYLKETLKNKRSKKTAKKVCLEIFNMIRTLYAGDPDFE